MRACLGSLKGKQKAHVLRLVRIYSVDDVHDLDPQLHAIVLTTI